PSPGWRGHATSHRAEFGPDDLAELVDDAVLCAIHDQVEAGLDVITDGEQTRLDFNLSFYGYLEGIERESAPARRLGPPAHDQRARRKRDRRNDRRAPRRRGWHRRREELLDRASRGGRAPRASLPAVRALGPAVIRARLRTEPNGTVGCASEAREPRPWGRHRARGGRRLIEPALADDAFLR